MVECFLCQKSLLKTYDNNRLNEKLLSCLNKNGSYVINLNGDIEFVCQRCKRDIEMVNKYSEFIKKVIEKVPENCKSLIEVPYTLS